MDQAQTISLEELSPERESFTLKATGGRVHELREFNLEDSLWIAREFSGRSTKKSEKEESVTVALSGENLDSTCKVAYRLLADKSVFPGDPDATWYDDDGYEHVGVPGWMKLKSKIKDATELNKIVTAVNQTVRNSNPREMAAAEKKLAPTKKKTTKKKKAKRRR